MDQSKLKILEQDPVFQAIQKQVLPDHTIVDAWLDEPRVTGPKDPKKILYVMVKSPKNVVEKYSINYNKVKRRLSTLDVVSEEAETST